MTAELPEPVQRRRRYPAVSTRTRTVFLESLAAGYSVTHAASAAGVYKRRLYELRAGDVTFAAAWREALEAGTHVLEDEARRRAVEGVEEPVYQRGESVGTIRRYSDVLLMFLLKKRDPSYRESAHVELTGAGGGPLEVTNPDVAAAIERFTSTVARLTARAHPVQAELPPGPSDTGSGTDAA